MCVLMHRCGGGRWERADTRNHTLVCHLALAARGETIYVVTGLQLIVVPFRCLCVKPRCLDAAVRTGVFVVLDLRGDGRPRQRPRPLVLCAHLQPQV